MDKVHGSNRYTLLKYTLYKIYLISMSVLVVFCTTLVGSTNKTDCHKKTEFYVFKNDALFVTGTHEPWGGRGQHFHKFSLYSSTCGAGTAYPSRAPKFTPSS